MFANRKVKICEGKQNHSIKLATGMQEWVAVIVNFIVVKRYDLKWGFYFGYKHDTQIISNFFLNNMISYFYCF